MPDTERACQNACKGNPNIQKDDFLCSGNYADQRAFIIQYGFDPCPGDDITVENTVIDPEGALSERENEKWERLRPVLGVLAILVFVALFILYRKTR